MRPAVAALGIVLLAAEAPLPVISIGLPGPPHHVELAGDRLVTAAWSMLAVIDLKTGITTVRQPQGSLVGALAVSPTGHLVAVGTCGHTIRLRDADSLAIVDSLDLRQECAEALSFSPDGALLATGAYGCGPEDNGLQIWDVRKGIIVRELGSGLGMRHVAFSGDGKWVAGVDDKEIVHVFEWPSGRKLRTFHGAGQAGYSGSEAFTSSDGRYVGWKGDGLRVWDVTTGKEIALPGAREYDVHHIPPDGPERRWKEIHVPASTARFLDDGRLAYVNESKIHLRTLPEGPEEVVELAEEKVEFSGDVGLIRQHEWLRIGPDARLVVGSHEDETAVWAVRERRWIETAPAVDLPTSVHWGPSGIIAWANLASGVRAWDARFGKPEDLGRDAKAAQRTAPSLYGSRFALSGFSFASIVDAETHRTLASRKLGTGPGTAIALSATGARVAFADPKEGLGIFDGQLRLIRRFAALGAHERLEEIALSPDGHWLAAGVGSPEPFLRVWSIESGEETTLDKQELTYGSQPPAFSSDSRVLASFRQGKSVVIWSTGSWTTVRTLSLASSGRSLAFAPFGSRLAVASDDDTAIWDSRTGAKLLTVSSPDVGGRRVIAWSPDGRRLASAADDGALRFWDADDGRLLASLYMPQATNEWLLQTPDGRLDGSEGALRRFVAWRTEDRVERDVGRTESKRVPGLWQSALGR